MAKKQKEEKVEKTVEQPIVDETVEKIKIKKPKAKKFEKTPEVIKIDIKDLKEKAEKVTKVDTSTPVKETETVEKTTETQKEPQAEETPVIEEVTNEEVEEVAEVIEKEITQPVETKVELPENVQKLMNFMKDTGGDINDYVKLNKDYSEMDNHTLLKEYYKSTKPHLESDEIDFLMKDQFSFD